MALHGMSEYTRPTLKKWQSVADALGYILICPIGSNFSSGYTKSPVDDRLEFVKFKQELEQRFTIDSENSLLIGFSRGGPLHWRQGSIILTISRTLYLYLGILMTIRQAIFLLHNKTMIIRNFIL